MNQLIDYGGVCRTAPATPGLLNIIIVKKKLTAGRKLDRVCRGKEKHL